MSLIFDTFIRGEVIDLVVLTEEVIDKTNWYKWFNDEENTKHMQQHYYPNSKELQLKYFKEEIEGNNKKLQLGIYHKKDKILIGTISLNNIDFQHRKCEISGFIGEKKYQTLKPFLESNKLLIKHAFEQLKLAKLNTDRIENVHHFEQKISSMPFISTPKVRQGAEHVYYVHACKFDEKSAGISRDAFIDAVRAELPHNYLREQEGVKLGSGYAKPLYLQPMFQNKIAYGSKGYPFSESDVDYEKGICPVTERMHFSELFSHEFILPSMQKGDIDDVVMAFEKVWKISRLR